MHIPSTIPRSTMDFSESFTPTTDDELESKVYTFTGIPLTALSKKTRHQLSKMLNIKKLLRSEEGYERDWRGIAGLSKQKSFCDESTIICDDPMARVLQLWCTNNPTTATIEHLEQFLGIIDRWDVSDDIYENFVEDAKNYKNQSLTKSNVLENQQSLEEVDRESVRVFGRGSDVNILTKGDVLRAQRGLSPQNYDAFILFADADVNYAVEILTRLEDNPDFNFKLCVKDRDLLGGVPFTHVALTQLIEERCKHLIVILTEEFLKSPENKFLVNYTQALQIQNKTRKIIPLLYDETLQIPRTLKIYTHLKYAKVTSLYNFWSKLADSIRNVNMIADMAVKKTQTRSLIESLNSNTFGQQQPQQQLQLKSNVNLHVPYTDIASISNDDRVSGSQQDIVSLDKALITKYSSDTKLNSDYCLMRNAHSASQLNTAVCYDSNQCETSDKTASPHDDVKKQGKKKWSHKLFKKVFSRSTNRLQEA